MPRAPMESFLPKRALFAPAQPSRRRPAPATLRQRSTSGRSQYARELTTVEETEEEPAIQDDSDIEELNDAPIQSPDDDEYDFASVLEDVLGQFSIELDTTSHSLRRMPSQLAPSTPKSEYDFYLDHLEPVDHLEPLPPLHDSAIDTDDSSSLLSLYLQDFPSPPTTPYTPSSFFPQTPTSPSSTRSRRSRYSFLPLGAPAMPSYPQSPSPSEKKKTRRRRPAYTALLEYVEGISTSGTESDGMPDTPPISGTSLPRPHVEEAQWDQVVDDLFRDCDEELLALEQSTKPPVPPRPTNLPYNKLANSYSRRSRESLSKPSVPTTPPRSILKKPSRPLIDASLPALPSSVHSSPSSPNPSQYASWRPMPSVPSTPSSTYSRSSDEHSRSSSRGSSRRSGRRSQLPDRPSIPIELLIRG